MITIHLTGEQALWLFGGIAVAFLLLCVADHYYWPFVHWNERRKRSRSERKR